MIAAMAASVVLVITTILMLYETLRLASNHLSELPLPPRARIIVVVLARSSATPERCGHMHWRIGF